MPGFGPGTILIPSDVNIGFGHLVAAETGLPSSSGLVVATGEMCAVFANGSFAITQEHFPDITNDSIFTFTADLTQQATVHLFTPFGPNWLEFDPIASDYAATFYAGKSGVTNAQVKSFTLAGVVGPTTWTLAIAMLAGLAVDLANTTLYYGDGAIGGAVKRWNLVGNVALPDLVAGTGINQLGVDMIVHPLTGNLVFLNQPNPAITPTQWFITVYTPAGAFVRTIALPLNADAVDAPRLSLDLGYSKAVWARTFEDETDTTAHFLRYDVTTGAFLKEWFQPQNDLGTAIPISCPFMAWDPVVPPAPSQRPGCQGFGG